MRVLQVCYKYPPKYSGYGKQLERVNCQLVEKVSKIAITVLASNGAGESARDSKRSSKRPISSGIEVVVSRFSGFYLYTLWLALRMMLVARRYDVIHCVKAGPEALVACLVGRLYGVPVVVKVCRDEYSLKGSLLNPRLLLRYLRAALVARFATMIAINSQIACDIRKVYSGASIVSIPNGVELDRFELQVGPDSRDRSCVNVAFVASISRLKGAFDLIDALKVCSTEVRTCVRFLGPLYDPAWLEYVEDAKEMIRGDCICIEYLGEVDAVAEVLADTDIVVLPSYFEGLPNCLLEAGAAGCALLGSDIPGTRDVIEHGVNGLLFECGDVHRLASALQELLNDGGRRNKMKINARAMSKRFDISRVCDQYSNLYQSVMGLKHIVDHSNL